MIDAIIAVIIITAIAYYLLADIEPQNSRCMDGCNNAMRPKVAQNSRCMEGCNIAMRLLIAQNSHDADYCYGWWRTGTINVQLETIPCPVEYFESLSTCYEKTDYMNNLYILGSYHNYIISKMMTGQLDRETYAEYARYDDDIVEIMTTMELTHPYSPKLRYNNPEECLRIVREHLS